LSDQNEPINNTAKECPDDDANQKESCITAQEKEQQAEKYIVQFEISDTEPQRLQGFAELLGNYTHPKRQTLV
jgi:hypothetical protein